MHILNSRPRASDWEKCASTYKVRTHTWKVLFYYTCYFAVDSRLSRGIYMSFVGIFCSRDYPTVLLAYQTQQGL